MAKGAKYRESPRLTRGDLERSLLEDLERFRDKWKDKEKFTNELDSWFNQVAQRIKSSLKHLRFIFHGECILQRRDVKQELQRLKDRYIFTVVDKAANNFAIQ